MVSTERKTDPPKMNPDPSDTNPAADQESASRIGRFYTSTRAIVETLFNALPRERVYQLLNNAFDSLSPEHQPLQLTDPTESTAYSLLNKQVQLMNQDAPTGVGLLRTMLMDSESLNDSPETYLKLAGNGPAIPNEPSLDVAVRTLAAKAHYFSLNRPPEWEVRAQPDGRPPQMHIVGPENKITLGTVVFPDNGWQQLLGTRSDDGQPFHLAPYEFANGGSHTPKCVLACTPTPQPLDMAAHRAAYNHNLGAALAYINETNSNKSALALSFKQGKPSVLTTLVIGIGAEEARALHEYYSKDPQLVIKLLLESLHPLLAQQLPNRTVGPQPLSEIIYVAEPEGELTRGTAATPGSKTIWHKFADWLRRVATP